MHCRDCGEHISLFRFLLRYRTVVRSHQSCKANDEDPLLQAFYVERLQHAAAVESPSVLLPRRRSQPASRALLRLLQPRRTAPEREEPVRPVSAAVALPAQEQRPSIDLATHSWRCKCAECLAADRAVQA